jgi:gliding motility-associated-like protein
MKKIFLPLLLALTQLCAGQSNRNLNTCSNWLNTPSNPSYVQVGQLNIPGHTITVEATFNRTTPYSGGILYAGDLVSKHAVPSDANYLLRPNEAEITTSNGYFRTPDICEIELHKTYHVAMVYDGSTLKFYRNGFLMSQVAATGDLFQNSWNTRIGYYEYQLFNTNFIGYINEVRIWNIVRTQAQIRTYMDISLPNPTTQTGLLAYYTFDDLINKQGNPAWNGVTGGSATINQTNPDCAFIADSCALRVSPENIINDYTEVLGFDVCRNELKVADATKYNIGDTVLIIQMKGAIIDSTNAAAFGNISNYNNSGNYEMNIIKQKNGNTLSLLDVLQRQYDIPAGKVQLVRVPYYKNITISNTLTCLPWDGSKGGILVLNVENTATLHADIDVTGRGFQGGNSPNPNTTTLYCNNNNYYYPSGTDAAADKGESITNTGDQIAWGKGSPANGGGGGNGHNSGGGGGSNGGAGGFGGYQLDACGGSATDNRGIGGKALIYSNPANKIFLGGGGGSGHTDNAGGSAMNGGNGGGIIIIKSPVIDAGSFKITAKGGNALQCNLSPIELCHDGSGGGGGGGAVLIDNSNLVTSTVVDVSGGKGGDLVIYNPPAGAGKIGPGGGGGAGIFWSNNGTLPLNIMVNKTGGVNGVIVQNGNDPYGTTPGQAGSNLFNFKIPVDIVVFKKNIDSVRINDSATSCSSFNFKGLVYTNISPLVTWQWSFGDGGTAFTQNTSHTYAMPGNFIEKLIVADVNGCKDSITKNISLLTSDFDFSYQQDICNPLSVKFFNEGNNSLNPYWSFGDGTSLIGTLNPVHTYSSPGSYIVKFSIQNGGCSDTVMKTISVAIIPADIIITPDTTICSGSTKQLRTIPSLSFCWSPVTFLNDPLSPNPITSTAQDITYYFTAKVTGNNIINNGDFNGGNTGFTSQYSYANPNVTEGQYFVGASPQAWNNSLSNCTDHTTGNGNMMLVNGAPAPDINVWKQSVTVIPNTNYAFSTWVQALWPPNPAQLAFSINGIDIGNLITASLPTCTWTQFYTTWNSGNNTSAAISIVNKNTFVQGNDFALDDISFAPVFVKRDSVKIIINNPFIKANNDSIVCSGSKIQMNTSGAATYTWTPVSGLSNPSIASPVATIDNTITYFVSGINKFGCTAKDTVKITALAKPVISKSRDTTICKNSSVQIFATGGAIYSWLPASTLNSAALSNPVASPLSTTKYFVTVTNNNSCSNTDSVLVKIRPIAVFSVSPNSSVCVQSPKQLVATGGTSYAWSPALYLSNANINNPVSTPVSSITYTVIIHDSTCNETGVLATILTALPLPDIKASSSNDLTCSLGSSQLTATGATNYLWTPATGLDNSSIANPVATPGNTTLYKVIGTDVSGCSSSAIVTVKADFGIKSLYLLPNSFTPNNDGINDCFGIKYWGVIKELDFSIYNRFGEKVFHTNDARVCWDGTYKQKLQDVNVFVYIIKAKTTCGSIERKGTVALLK